MSRPIVRRAYRVLAVVGSGYGQGCRALFVCHNSVVYRSGRTFDRPLPDKSHSVQFVYPLLALFREQCPLIPEAKQTTLHFGPRAEREAVVLYILWNVHFPILCHVLARLENPPLSWSIEFRNFLPKKAVAVEGIDLFSLRRSNPTVLFGLSQKRLLPRNPRPETMSFENSLGGNPHGASFLRVAPKCQKRILKSFSKLWGFWGTGGLSPGKANFVQLVNFVTLFVGSAQCSIPKVQCPSLLLGPWPQGPPLVKGVHLNKGRAIVLEVVLDGGVICVPLRVKRGCIFTFCFIVIRHGHAILVVRKLRLGRAVRWRQGRRIQDTHRFADGDSCFFVIIFIRGIGDGFLGYLFPRSGWGCWPLGKAGGVVPWWGRRMCRLTVIGGVRRR